MIKSCRTVIFIKLCIVRVLVSPKVSPRPLEGDGGLLSRERGLRPGHVVVGRAHEALLELGDEIVGAVLGAALEGQVGAGAEHGAVAAVWRKTITGQNQIRGGKYFFS